jgi:cysteine-rich repeat protein
MGRMHGLVLGLSCLIAASCGSGVGAGGIDADLTGCGDGELSEDEECDDGNDDPTDACVRCRIATCGDGELFAFQEQCDDGNTIDGDDCSANCQYENCGDGELQEIEQCEGSGTSDCQTECETVGSAECIADTCTLMACVPPVETCNVIDDDCDAAIDTESCLVEIHRFYNQNTGDHLYRADTGALAGYVLEGQSFWVYAAEVPGSIAIYQKRSGNGRNHMITPNADEANALGYTLESTIGYVVPENGTTWDAAAKPVGQLCRYYHSGIGDHLVEVVAAQSTLGPIGYAQENCFFWAWDPQT